MTRSQRVRDAEIEAIQGAVTEAFQSVRNEIAKWVFDYIPDAHMLTAEKIAKIFPLLAIAFKIATPPGVVFDPLDDIVQDLARTLREEAGRRVGAANAQHTSSAPSPSSTSVPVAGVPDTQYARLLNAATSLPQQQFDDLMAWFLGLSDDDKSRFYFLVANATTDAQLDALIRQRIGFLRAAIAQVKLPTPHKTIKTFLHFRNEVGGDAVLMARVQSFLHAKALDELRFWKAVEKEYGKRVKDKEDFERLMNLSPDEIFSFLHLAPTPTPKRNPFSGLGASIGLAFSASTLPADVEKFRNWAEKWSKK